jgi:glutaredoxin
MPTHEVILYSRHGCHLCEVVKETLVRLTHRASFTWREVDIDADENLKQKYTDEVPVVFIDGRKAFKYSMKQDEFLKKLAAR